MRFIVNPGRKPVSPTTLRAVASIAAFAATALPAAASTFNGADYAFMFMGASGATVSITSSQAGTFASAADIASFFNSADYKAELLSTSGTVSSLDKTNSTWSVTLTPGAGAAATLTATAESLVLSLSTPQEFSEAYLMLRANDGRSGLQYRQSNNITDQSFVNFQFDAMFMANSNTAFGQPFVFKAVAAPVPETSTALLLAVGGLGLAMLASRRRRPAN